MEDNSSIVPQNSFGQNNSKPISLKAAIKTKDTPTIKSQLRELKIPTDDTNPYWNKINKKLTLISQDYDNILHEAATENNIPQAIYALSLKLAVNSTNHDKKTPLHLAAQKGNFEMCKFLFHAAANVNAQDNRDNLPLHYSLQLSSNNIFNLLLPSTDVTKKNMFGNTSLHVAAIQNNPLAVKALVAKSPNLVKEINKQDQTALHFSFFTEPKDPSDKINMHKIMLLLAQRDIEGARKSIPHMLNSEIANNQPFVKKLLSSGVQQYIDARPSLSNLKVAIEEGNLDQFNTLIANGAQLEYSDMLFAIRAAGSLGASDHKYEILEAILDKTKCNLNIPSIGAPCLPIHLAIEGDNDPKTVEILIKHGAKVDLPNIHGLYPIDMAIICNNLEIVKILFENQKFYTSWSIYRAIEHNNPEILQLLVRPGVDLTTHNLREETPLDYALKEKKYEMAKILIDGGADVSQKEILKMASKDTEIYNFLKDNSSEFMSHAINFAVSSLPIPSGEFEQNISGNEDDSMDIE